MEDKKFEKVLKDIGLNLYTYRVYRRVGVETAAKAADITPATLVRIENGRHPHCRLSIIFSLTEFYNISTQAVWETF